MKNFLLCEPLYFDIRYEINPWMSRKNLPNKRKAQNQWEKLRAALVEFGANVSLIEPQADLPDMVFSANGALIVDKCAYLSKFQHEERQGEEIHWEKWLSDNGYNIIKSKHCFEGAGDALWNGKTMFCGYGFRSELMASNRVLYEMLKDIVVLKLNDPYFYHLDTCFCPLNKDLALVWPGAFDAESYERLKRHTNLIEVCERDAKRFACNAVVVNNIVLLPSGCRKTESQLHSHSFDTYPLEMTEFIKSGGACKCLTLNVN